MPIGEAIADTYGLTAPLGNFTMETITTMKKAPWHSVKQHVHHNNTECNTGNNIERENLREGTGGKPLCKECADLNARGR